MKLSFLLPLDSLPDEFQAIPFVKEFPHGAVALGVVCPGCARQNTLFVAVDRYGDQIAIFWCSECAQIFVQINLHLGN